MLGRTAATLATAFLLATASARAAVDPSPAASVAPTPLPSASPHATTVVELATSRIDTMLQTGHADASWFSASFLEKVPTNKVDDVIANLEGALGKYRSVDFTPAKFVAHFERGTDDVLIHLDADDKIDGLIFRPPAVTTQ